MQCGISAYIDNELSKHKEYIKHFRCQWCDRENFKNICQKCELGKKAYLEMNPGWKGTAMCEECYEKSKEFFVYMEPFKDSTQVKTIQLGEK